MIKIDWKDAKKDIPEFTITEGVKISSVEIVQCLVSDGNDVWDDSYDPTEGFDPSIIRFIEFKNIKP